MGNGKSKEKVLKFNGTQMQKDGLLVEIKDLSANQYSNVQIQLRSLGEPGTFEMRATMMGVEVEKWKFYLRDLLEEQREGKTITEVLNRLSLQL
ncbi:hypothetical protein ScPMuIL_018131 [Solemya velum]